MQADDLACAVQFFRRMNRCHSGCRHNLVGAICIVGKYIHAETLCNARHITAYVSKGVYAKFLTHEFGAAGAVIEVSHGIDHESESKFRHCVAILPRCVHGYDLVGCSCHEIDIVVACTGSDNDLKLLRRVKHFGIDDVGSNDECIGVCYGFEQLLFGCIFFEECELVARLLHHFAYAVHGNFCKGFLCCN